MRRIVSVYVLACMVCAVPVIAQGEPEVDILTISRFKDGDKQSGGSSSELVEPVSKKQVLDINGRVHVGIDIDKLKIAIEARRKEDAAGKSEAHLQSLRDVKGVLAGDSSDQQGWALSASAADSLVQLAVQVGNLRDGFTPLTLTPRAEGSTSNMDTLWALGHDVVQLDSDLNALAALAALQTSAEQEMAVYVVLGAWIQKGRRGAGVPVHLPGFDTYEEHTPTDVARWVFALGEGDRKLLEELRKPNTNLGNVVSNLRKHVKACGEALEKAADAQLAQLKGIDSVGKLTEGVTDVAELKKIGEAVGTIAAEVKAIRESLAKVKAAADDLKSWRPPTVAAAIDATRYTSLVDDLVEPISVVREEVEKIVISLKTIKDASDAISEAIEKGDLTDAMKVVVGGAKKVVDEDKACQTLAKLWALLGLPILGGSSLTEFGDKVLRHTLDALPTETTVNLRTAGEREQGDHLVLRIAMVLDKEALPKNTETVTVLETQKRALYILGLQVRPMVAPGYVLTKDSDDEDPFAPVVMFRFGYGLRNRFYQEWISLGVGPHIAYMNPDGEGGEELGWGVTVSAVRDWVQVSVGHNRKADEDYVMFSTTAFNGIRELLSAGGGSAVTDKK